MHFNDGKASGDRAADPSRFIQPAAMQLFSA